jgi:hypothetical protein
MLKYQVDRNVLINIIDYYIQRCIIGKEFDITIKIINNIVYVRTGKGPTLTLGEPHHQFPPTQMRIHQGY